MTPAPSCCSGSSRRPTNAAPSASEATGRSNPGAGSCPSTPLPSASWTACSITRMSWSPAERKRSWLDTAGRVVGSGAGRVGPGRAGPGVWRVEGYPQPDLDLPAGDVDVFDQQAQQLLSLWAVELVYYLADLLREVGDAAAEQVPAGECGALGGEGVAFGLQVALPGGDFAGAAVQFGQVGAQRVVVAAVVAVPGAVAAAHLVAVGADIADPASDQALEQPFAGFGAARAPFGVAAGDAAGCLELLVGDDAGAADRDPVLARARDLAGAANGPRVGDGLGAVEVDPADVSLVAEQPAQGGGPPGWL